MSNHSQDRLGLRTHVRELPAFRLLVMFWGGLAVLDVIRGASDTVQIAAMLVAVALCARACTRTTAMAIACIAWLLVNGFVLNSYGQLRWTGLGDLAVGGLLTIVALAARR